MTSRKEMKDGKCLAGVSGMWCLHGATFGTVWERGTESPAREDSRNNGQPGWRRQGLGKGLGFRLENILCFLNKKNFQKCIGRFTLRLDSFSCPVESLITLIFITGDPVLFRMKVCGAREL